MSTTSQPRLFEALNEQGLPIIALPALRVAQENLAEIPPVSAVWSSLPPWCQEAIQKAMNEVYKVHLSEKVKLVKAMESLSAHRSNGTFPQVVLAAVPGVKNFHMDNIISSENQQLISSSMENVVRQARSGLLNTIMESKERALQAHTIKSSPAFALSVCRDRMFDSIVKMGLTMDTLTSRDLYDVIRSLCHLSFQIGENGKRQAWTKVQLERKQELRASAVSAVMDTSSNLTSGTMTESIEKLIAKQVSASVAKLGKGLKKLSVANSPSSRRPGSGSRGSSGPSRSSGPPRSSSSGSKSGSGKGSRPAGPRTPSGRIGKGASGPPPPRRLAPAPTPFKQLKGKGNHKRG